MKIFFDNDKLDKKNDLILPVPGWTSCSVYCCSPGTPTVWLMAETGLTALATPGWPGITINLCDGLDVGELNTRLGVAGRTAAGWAGRTWEDLSAA